MVVIEIIPNQIVTANVETPNISGADYRGLRTGHLKLAVVERHRVTAMGCGFARLKPAARSVRLSRTTRTTSWSSGTSDDMERAIQELGATGRAWPVTVK
jgi:adenine deaminase